MTDDLKECWQTLRRIPVEKAISRTMSASEAIERMMAAIEGYSQATRDRHTDEEEKNLAKPRLVLTPTLGNIWTASIEGTPLYLGLKKASPAKGVPKAIQNLFVEVHDTILRHLLTDRKEALKYKQKAAKIEEAAFELEHVRQRMGGFEPDQCPLPFPPMDASVAVDSYVADKEIDPDAEEDQIDRCETEEEAPESEPAF